MKENVVSSINIETSKIKERLNANQPLEFEDLKMLLLSALAEEESNDSN